MSDQEIINSYINELAAATSALVFKARKGRTEVQLGDSVDTLLILNTCAQGKRISGRVDNLVTVMNFELRIRPRELEFIYPPAGPRATLRAQVLPGSDGTGPHDYATRVATLARRLKHFAIMKRVRLGIRDSLSPPARASLLPQAS